MNMAVNTKQKNVKVNPNSVVYLHKIATDIQNLLIHMQQPVIKNNPKALNESKAKLKAIVKDWIQTTQRLLLLNSQGTANFFAEDSFRILKADTDWGKPEMIKVYEFAHLVNTYAKELLAEEAEASKNAGAPIDPNTVLDQSTDSSVEVMDFTLNNGDNIKIDKESGDMEVLTANGKRAFFPKQFKGIKGFINSIWNWIISACQWIKTWISNKVKAPKDNEIMTQDAFEQAVSEGLSETTENQNLTI